MTKLSARDSWGAVLVSVLVMCYCLYLNMREQEKKAAPPPINRCPCPVSPFHEPTGSVAMGSDETRDKMAETVPGYSNRKLEPEYHNDKEGGSTLDGLDDAEIMMRRSLRGRQ